MAGLNSAPQENQEPQNRVKKERLDKLLVSRGLADTRTKAQALILAGKVFASQQRLDKAGQLVATDAPLTVKEAMPYVGRGGFKLAAALDHFKVEVTGRNCLDIGASTGGFTDCLLQRGAGQVVALDVGHGQIDWKLRQDARVEVREQINARYLKPEDFSGLFSLVVADVSFISLTKILPVMPPLVTPDAQVIVLIKPQFEVGKAEVGKGGIVRDQAAQLRVVEEITTFAAGLGLRLNGVIDSPILGADGNREFLACFELSGSALNNLSRKGTIVNHKQALLEKIAARKARVGVIGLGYVGLPLAVEFAESGFKATGFEVDARKAETINRGESYIIDVPNDAVAKLVKADKLQATVEFTALKDQDIIIICVPTPLRKTKEPDVSYILSAAEKIQAALHPGQLIILESTTYPGTTDEVLRPMFDEMGLKLDQDYFLAFSPERVDPGNPRFNTKNIPKVVGGVTADSADVAAAAYGTIVNNVHRVESARAAEMAKLLENTFRSVNIALVNELSQLCHTLNIDTWEVIAAAATKPFGFMAFYPGPGIGGHCIPLDPHYLSWKARMHGFEARFISLAEEVNSRMPQHVVELVTKGLNHQRKSVNGARVLMLGVAYKRDIDDVRESPALGIIEKLLDLGADFTYHDPYIPEVHLEGNRHDILKGSALTQEAVQNADCVLIVTDHSNVDYKWVAEHAKLVVDTRNATRSLKNDKLDEKIIRL